ncbi:MAG TPA: hypothetical protein VI300_06810 [Solirubrobacter sp.]
MNSQLGHFPGSWLAHDRLAKQLDPRIDTVALVWQYAGADYDDCRRS